MKENINFEENEPAADMIDEEIGGIKGGTIYAIAFVMLAAFLFASCSDNDVPEKDFVEKKVIISLDGINDSISPWMSFTAYTTNQSILRVVKDNDTLNCKEGVLKIPNGSCQIPCQIELYSRSRYPEYIHVGVTYRKRRTRPLPSDDLNVKVEAFRDNLLELDTSFVMHSFKIDDKIKEADYIFSINF